MKIVVCLDENGGMLFNNRRQSRDIEVLKDIFADLNGEKLHIAPFSVSLFENFADSVIIDDDFLGNSQNDDVCFVENSRLSQIADKITTLTVYNWNRKYPADFVCDIDFSAFSLVSESEFEGKSHPKITKQVFMRR